MDTIIQSDDPITYETFRDYLGYEEEKINKKEKKSLKKLVKNLSEFDK